MATPPNPDQDREQSRFLDIGRAIGAFGLAGVVRVLPLTDFPERFADLRVIHVGESRRTYEVESARQARGQIYLKLKGVDDATAAEVLRGELLRIPLEEAVPLPEGTYYWYQILDLEVVTLAGERLGRVAEILRTGANDVYIVRGPRGELLLPAIEDVVREVDVEGGRLVVELMPGLLDADG